MKQELFSKMIFDFLQQTYPEFLPVKYFEDGSFDCNVKNPMGQFSMWIATYNSEITYGFESPDGKTDIHSHISCYEIEDLPECLGFLRKWIDSVSNNLTLIYFNDYDEWDWIDRDTLLKNEIKERRTYKKLYWQDA
jgi:hypothetical protein